MPRRSLGSGTSSHRAEAKSGRREANDCRSLLGHQWAPGAERPQIYPEPPDLAAVTGGRLSFRTSSCTRHLVAGEGREGLAQKAATVYKEPNVNVSDIAPTNSFGGQGSSAGSMTALESNVSTRRLDWTGRHAFIARYAVQPVVDPILSTRWGPRHDQSVSYHLATVDSPTGLVYAYDLTWDEYAVLATGVPKAAVEDALGRALASDAPPSPEVFAGLLTDSLTAPTLATGSSAEWATGVEL